MLVENSREDYFFGFAFFIADFLAPVKQSKKVESRIGNHFFGLAFFPFFKSALAAR